MTRPTHGKRDRERSKKEKAEAKRERRQELALMKAAADEEGPAPRPDGAETATVLRMLEDLHHRHENGEVGEEDFQLAKADLLSRLVVD